MTPDLLLERSIRMSGVVLIALAATVVLRRQSAAARHWILAVGIACAAAAPLFERVAPAWQVPFVGSAWSLAHAEDPNPVSRGRIAASERASDHAAVRNESSAEPMRIAWRTVSRVWIAGAAVSLLTIVAGFGRLGWMAFRARRVRNGSWPRLAEEVSRSYGMRRRVRLLLSDQRMAPATWGCLRPGILLPPDATAWSRERIRIVLLHEIAHVARSDWPVQLLAEIVRAVYWFNPLMWIACRRLREESERAADDAVMGRGIEGTVYASELLSIARSFRANHPVWLPAAGIARPSTLERRVSAMLNARVNRQPISRIARLGTVTALVAIAVAIGSAQNLFSSFSGAVYDSMNGLLPNVRMVLTNVQSGAKYEIRSDANGRFEFVALPPGRYSLETELMGFAAFRGALDISGPTVQRDFKLQVGSLQETVAVRIPRPDDVAVDPAPRSAVSTRFSTVPSACQGAPTTGGGIGGNIRPPTKLIHTVPVYPPGRSASKEGGLVVLDAQIGTDGTISDTHTVSSTHPDFEAAVTDAVRQWAFSQTLLNCVPVEVAMRVTVRFLAE